MTTEYCPCGLLLHYTDPQVEAYVRQKVAELGELQPITVFGMGTWLVSRHYYALHGLNAWELPGSRWEKIA